MSDPSGNHHNGSNNNNKNNNNNSNHTGDGDGGSQWNSFTASGTAICTFVANGEHQTSLNIGDQVSKKISSIIHLLFALHAG